MPGQENETVLFHCCRCELDYDLQLVDLVSAEELSESDVAENPQALANHFQEGTHNAELSSEADQRDSRVTSLTKTFTKDAVTKETKESTTDSETKVSDRNPSINEESGNSSPSKASSDREKSPKGRGTGPEEWVTCLEDLLRADISAKPADLREALVEKGFTVTTKQVKHKLDKIRRGVEEILQKEREAREKQEEIERTTREKERVDREKKEAAKKEERQKREATARAAAGQRPAAVQKASENVERPSSASGVKRSNIYETLEEAKARIKLRSKESQRSKGGQRSKDSQQNGDESGQQSGSERSERQSEGRSDGFSKGSDGSYIDQETILRAVEPDDPNYMFSGSGGFLIVREEDGKQRILWSNHGKYVSNMYFAQPTTETTKENLKDCMHGPYCYRCVHTMLKQVLPFCAGCRSLLNTHMSFGNERTLPALSEADRFELDHPDTVRRRTIRYYLGVSKSHKLADESDEEDETKKLQQEKLKNNQFDVKLSNSLFKGKRKPRTEPIDDDSFEYYLHQAGLYILAEWFGIDVLQDPDYTLVEHVWYWYFANDGLRGIGWLYHAVILKRLLVPFFQYVDPGENPVFFPQILLAIGCLYYWYASGFGFVTQPAYWFPDIEIERHNPHWQKMEKSRSARLADIDNSYGSTADSFLDAYGDSYSGENRNLYSRGKNSKKKQRAPGIIARWVPKTIRMWIDRIGMLLGMGILAILIVVLLGNIYEGMVFHPHVD